MTSRARTRIRSCLAGMGNPLSASNTLRGGDTATGIVGVMTYTWAGNAASGNAYRVRPIGALNGFVQFDPDEPSPERGPAHDRLASRGEHEPPEFLQHVRRPAGQRRQLPVRTRRSGSRLPWGRHAGGVRPAVAQDGDRHPPQRRGHHWRDRNRKRRLRAKQRDSVPRRSAQRRQRARHLCVRRRRCRDRPGERARHRRDQGGSRLQARKRGPHRPNGGTQQRRLRQRW